MRIELGISSVFLTLSFATIKGSEDQSFGATIPIVNMSDFYRLPTEDGLQVWHDGQWIQVKVPRNPFIVNTGDMLENISNGYFKSSLHQVLAKLDVERHSIVYFIHPRHEDYFRKGFRFNKTDQSISRSGNSLGSCFKNLPDMG